jgi:hypothetical protein
VTNPKRPRGRPKGTQKDDRSILYQIAAKKVQSPALPIATALKQINRKADAALIRRIQFKWKMWGAKLVEEVKAKTSAPAQVARFGLYGGVRAGDAVNNAIRLAREIADSPVMRMMRDWENNPTTRYLRAVQAQQKALRELTEGPIQHYLREVHNSPAIRAAQELQNSPAMKMIRDLQNSPALRAAREAAELMRRYRL